MDRKLGMKKMNPMMSLAMKRTMPKNMMGRKKGPMIARQEFQSPPKEEREEMEDEMKKEPEMKMMKRGIERMRRNSSYS